MRESIVFYKSYFDSIEQLPQNQQLPIYKALLNFAFNDREPENELKGASLIIFEMAKPVLRSSKRNYDNGSKGGRPTGDEDNSPKKQLEGIEFVTITENQYQNACERLGQEVVDKTITILDSWFSQKGCTARQYIGKNNYGFFRADNWAVKKAQKEINNNDPNQPNWSI